MNPLSFLRFSFIFFWGLSIIISHPDPKNCPWEKMATSAVNDSIDMILIPSGEFTSGKNGKLFSIDYDYEIMKYPVTNAQYIKFLSSMLEIEYIEIRGNSVEACYGGDEFIDPDYYDLYSLGVSTGNFGRISWNGKEFTITKGYENHPVVKVSWFGAYAFASVNGLRLPTESEWEKAARGSSGTEYPWGNNISGSYANFSNSGDIWDNGTTPIGYYDGSVKNGNHTSNSSSPYGVYDMAGNVWEWTSDWTTDKPRGIILRGGAWGFDPGFSRTWFRYTSTPNYNNSQYGFRCVKRIPQKNNP